MDKDLVGYIGDAFGFYHDSLAAAAKELSGSPAGQFMSKFGIGIDVAFGLVEVAIAPEGQKLEAICEVGVAAAVSYGAGAAVGLGVGLATGGVGQSQPRLAPR